jgi:hypothetical protein
MVEAALDDILVLVAMRTSWMLHTAMLTLLFPFRHSPNVLLSDARLRVCYTDAPKRLVMPLQQAQETLYAP